MEATTVCISAAVMQEVCASIALPVAAADDDFYQFSPNSGPFVSNRIKKYDRQAASNRARGIATRPPKRLRQWDESFMILSSSLSKLQAVILQRPPRTRYPFVPKVSAILIKVYRSIAPNEVIAGNAPSRDISGDTTMNSGMVHWTVLMCSKRHTKIQLCHRSHWRQYWLERSRMQ